MPEFYMPAVLFFWPIFEHSLSALDLVIHGVDLQMKHFLRGVAVSFSIVFRACVATNKPKAKTNSRFVLLSYVYMCELMLN